MNTDDRNGSIDLGNIVNLGNKLSLEYDIEKITRSR